MALTCNIPPNGKQDRWTAGKKSGTRGGFKKDWRWWVVGILILALAVFFVLNKKNNNK